MFDSHITAISEVGLPYLLLANITAYFKESFTFIATHANVTL